MMRVTPSGEGLARCPLLGISELRHPAEIDRIFSDGSELVTPNRPRSFSFETTQSTRFDTAAGFSQRSRDTCDAIKETLSDWLKRALNGAVSDPLTLPAALHELDPTIAELLRSCAPAHRSSLLETANEIANRLLVPSGYALAFDVARGAESDLLRIFYASIDARTVHRHRGFGETIDEFCVRTLQNDGGILGFSRRNQIFIEPAESKRQAARHHRELLLGSYGHNELLRELRNIVVKNKIDAALFCSEIGVECTRSHEMRHAMDHLAAARDPAVRPQSLPLTPIDVVSRILRPGCFHGHMLQRRTDSAQTPYAGILLEASALIGGQLDLSTKLIEKRRPDLAVASFAYFAGEHVEMLRRATEAREPTDSELLLHIIVTSALNLLTPSECRTACRNIRRADDQAARFATARLEAAYTSIFLSDEERRPPNAPEPSTPAVS